MSFSSSPWILTGWIKSPGSSYRPEANCGIRVVPESLENPTEPTDE
jgi:hypothetical protein